MGWIIYISGFILTYLIYKGLRNKDNDNTWGDVGATIFASIFSWGAIVFMVLALGVIILNETIKAKNPPKWL
jgi:hypothetical protein